MKLFKSLLLGSAAGLFAVSGASAADLGVKKPSPVEYVKVCSAHGAGFFYIPGSDVCMKIGGRVRAEYLYSTPWLRGDDTSSFRSNGRIEADIRQTTSYGLLRAFVRYDVYADGGRYAGNASIANPFLGTNQLGNAQNTNALLDKAFIQFYTGSAGFFTAGRAASFFDFYANSDNYSALPGSDTGAVNLFAYTATFGGGLSATISAEDQYARRAGGANGNFAGLPPFNSVAYSGQSLPDIVGNLRIDQAWGSAQLSGAVHQMHIANRNVLGGFVDGGYGWAIQGGVKINLPMIAAGDALWLQAAYSNGANSFGGGAGGVNASKFGVTRTAVASVDGFVDNFGSVKKATSWSVVASFLHNFNPNFQGAIYGGYGVVDYSGSTVTTGFNDFKQWAIGARLNWIPVRGFTIGTEVMYNSLDPKGTVSLGNTNLVAAKSKYDGITARIRFQRDF